MFVSANALFTVNKCENPSIATSQCNQERIVDIHHMHISRNGASIILVFRGVLKVDARFYNAIL